MRQIFFCHIPKTAGTAVAAAFEASFRPDKILPRREMAAANNNTYPPLDDFVAACKARSARLVRGHYHLSLRHRLRDPLVVVVMRDPVERAASHVRHMIRKHPERRDWTFTELDQGRLPVPDNVMTRLLGGSLDDVGAADLASANHALMRGELGDPERRLASAIAALDSIDLLGFCDDLETFARALRILRVKFDSSVGVNQTEKLVFTPQQMATLEERNALDVALYGHAKQHYAAPDRLRLWRRAFSPFG